MVYERLRREANEIPLTVNFTTRNFDEIIIFLGITKNDLMMIHYENISRAPEKI
jgi:hypothetical protein